MNILKKSCVKRALRTFLQTAVGYIADQYCRNGSDCKIRCSGTLLSAISAGMAAVRFKGG